MTLTRLIVCAALLASATLSHALELAPYSAEALAKAQQANQPVALHFHADWCPTCRAQDKALDTLKAEKGLDITVLKANYDTEKELKRRFRINGQSTLVVLKGDKEAARLMGDASTDGIRTALKAGL